MNRRSADRGKGHGRERQAGRETPGQFDACQSVPQAGVLLMLPFWEQLGLFDFKKHYRELSKGYYYIS